MKKSKKKRVSIFDALLGKFRIRILENDEVKTSDGKKRKAKDCPNLDEKPL